MSYFDFEKKKKAIEELKICFECAEKARIKGSMFINFGLLLGIIRENDFIPWDNDVDICIKRDEITASQELEYFNLLKDRGMFEAREKISVIKHDKGFNYNQLYKNQGSGEKVRFAWFSLRKAHDYPKFCHWFMFEWNNIFWHTKGGRWIETKKFDINKLNYTLNDDAIMKGIPAEYIRELIEIDFHGMKIKIPKNYGSCLDFMYPNWLIPVKTGSSSKKILCVVPNILDQSTWKMSIE